MMTNWDAAYDWSDHSLAGYRTTDNVNDADFDPTKKYPAIVWVHGGPMRQMRGSWHISSTYAHFYAYNQFLANQGYVVLSPNFRGGIGYGRDFRLGLYQKKGVDDTIDIINSGQYLKDLPFLSMIFLWMNILFIYVMVQLFQWM